ncbi:MAG: DEAD/DEAH box helicase [Anaerolineae bacterium]
MSDNPFYRLAPFIQEFIYAQNWTELRAVQVEACRVIFDTDAHLLLATGTASGKTEAAFLPVLTLLEQDPAHSVAVLYIGPTKALINDQFLRLNDLLKAADIPVSHWHGDVARREKQRLLKSPAGVLQITPESLESLLVNRSTQLVDLLGDLRFVIIDEVHVFMGSDRGRQILCQLARLSRYMRAEPRRIGLSATLGDYAGAEEWLRAGTKRPVITPALEGGPRRVRLAVEHFVVPDDTATTGSAGAVEVIGGTAEPPGEGGEDDLPAPTYYRHVYNASAGRKCLIFANSRAETEAIIAAMRQIAEREGQPDVYHVHHGSISAALREAAEEAMREPYAPAVVAATVTMELGIDIGQLERVVQLQAPLTVSSFLQRLGRSGRRGDPSEMWVVCREEKPATTASLPEQIPWQLLQSIAVIQLYLEERWIEPVPPVQYPFSLLYHQTMSTLAAYGELSPAALAQRVLTLPPFQAVSADDFRVLLHHLIQVDHIQQTDERGLLMGLGAEPVVRNFRFYAVFADSEEYSVKEESREIGSVVMPPPPGERFGLAGRTWEVLEVDDKRKVVFVKRVRGRASAHWTGSDGITHTKVLQRMRRVLLEEEGTYPYLQSRAAARLEEARRLGRNSGLAESNVVSLGGDRLGIFPWTGAITYRTLDRVLRRRCGDFIDTSSMGGEPPYYLVVRACDPDPAVLLRALKAIGEERITGFDLVSEGEGPEQEKYDEFVPLELLRKAFATDWLDVAGLQGEMREWG